jgi:hypothetical protein
LIPYSGIWQQTRKMKRVMTVHRTFSRNGIWEEGEGGVEGCWVVGGGVEGKAERAER